MAAEPRLSAHDVLDALSFGPSQSPRNESNASSQNGNNEDPRQQHQRFSANAGMYGASSSSFPTQPYKDQAVFDPLALPPAAPPPPPPPSDSDAASVRSITTVESLSGEASNNKAMRSQQKNAGALPDYPVTYQEGAGAQPTTYMDRRGFGSTGYTEQFTSNRSRAAFSSTNPNSGSNDDPNHLLLHSGGDVNIRPNTGETNDEYGGIGSLREITTRLRWLTIITCGASIVWEGFAFPMRLLVDTWVHPAQVVLGGYLAVFCLLLLSVELNFKLRENFGFLYHPLGRAWLLFLMSGMCFCILAAWWETILGVAFLVCFLGYAFAYWKYPEYRAWQSYSDNEVWNDVQQATSRSGITSWANPYNHDPSSLPNLPSTLSQERSSLLTKF